MKKEYEKILEEIKANSAKLNSCPRHLFEYETVTLGMKIECSNCQGQMRLTDIGNYIKGYEAGGGNPNDIWPGWDKNIPKS